MKAFVFTLDAMIAMIVILYSAYLLPHFPVKYYPHHLELIANSLLAAADASGVLYDVVTSQNEGQKLVNRLHNFYETRPYCAFLAVYRVSSSVSELYNVTSSGCGAVPEDFPTYTAYRVVLYPDSTPPSGTRVYGVRLIVWPEPS